MSQPLVSGPGALSQRTDGGQPIRHIADAKYGEDKEFVGQQKMAPLADGGPTGPAPGGLPAPPTGLSAAGPGPTGSPPSQPITPFGAPTGNPDQPVTAGAQPFGAPAQPPKINLQPNQLSQALAPYVAGDDSGVLADFMWNLSQMGL
jgi:hypothetical protein